MLIPLEDECEEHDGLTPESHAAAKRAVLDAGFNAINHPVADGGQGYDLFQQMLIEEQWGHATGRAVGHPVASVDPAAAGTEEQKERYLRPAIRGERRDAYAITEEGAGSDVSMVATVALDATAAAGCSTARSGTSRAATSPTSSWCTRTSTATRRRPPCSWWTRTRPGVRLVRTPKYTHTFVFEHPIFAFDGVRLADDADAG